MRGELRGAQPRAAVLTTLDQFQRIEPEWDRLSSIARSPIVQAAWVRACIEAGGDGPAVPAIVTISRDGRLVAGAPLVAMRDKGVGVLRIAGAELLGEPNDLLAVDGAAMRALVRALLAMRKPIRLLRLPSQGEAAEVLSRLPTHAAVTRRVISVPHPTLSLTGPVESLLSASLRSDLRRARRRAEGLGLVEYLHSRPDASSALDELHAAMAVEAAGWKSGSGTALVSDAPRREFFERYALEAARRGTLRIATLSIGGQPAAVQIAVETNGGYWLLKIGFDERYSRASPGQLLMLEALRSAHARGLASFELLGSAAPWTRRWCPTERDTDDWAIYPWSARTALLVGSTMVGRASGSLSRALGSRAGTGGT